MVTKGGPRAWRLPLLPIRRPPAAGAPPVFAIRPLPLAGAEFDGAIASYREAFAQPPYSDPQRASEVRRRLILEHAPIDGFRAFYAAGADGTVIGMTYGYRGLPGQWWHEAVRAKLTPAQYGRWLVDCYEVVEVAVAPPYQSCGAGRALVDELLRDLPHRTAVLSTRTDSRAHRLYRRLGFETLVTMRFMDGGYPFYVMGKRLQATG